MLRFAQKLVNVRESLGFKSARAFYLHLSERAELEFNYSYYARIEKGAVLPSEKVVSTLCSHLEKHDAESLILAFCETLFPRYDYLFQAGSDAAAALSKGPPKTSPQTSADDSPKPLRQQKALSNKQVFALSQTREHYFLFLVLTLSRGWIAISELAQSFGAKTIERVIEDLRLAKILVREGDRVFNSSKEMIFPPTDEGLKKVYAQLDSWDLEFASWFDFEKLEERHLLRRVSPRFLPLILDQAKNVLNLTRAAEELDPKHNQDVLQFSIRIAKGRIPG